MKNYIQPGDVVPLTAPATLQSGDGVLVGQLFGVATKDAASGDSVNVSLNGVFEMPKASDDIAEGAAVYWDDTSKNMTTTSAGNTQVGAAVRAAATGATRVRVRLNG